MVHSPRPRRTVFWLGLLAFIVWDLAQGPRPDVWQEPPLLAAGSGQAPTGGHCSAAR